VFIKATTKQKKTFFWCALFGLVLFAVSFSFLLGWHSVQRC